MNMRKYNLINFKENSYYESPERVIMDKMQGPAPTNTEIKFFQIK